VCGGVFRDDHIKPSGYDFAVAYKKRSAFHSGFVVNVNGGVGERVETGAFVGRGRGGEGLLGGYRCMLNDEREGGQEGEPGQFYHEKVICGGEGKKGTE